MSFIIVFSAVLYCRRHFWYIYVLAWYCYRRHSCRSNWYVILHKGNEKFVVVKLVDYILRLYFYFSPGLYIFNFFKIFYWYVTVLIA